MSDQRRRCLGHPDDPATAHYWDALTGLPSDFRDPNSTSEFLVGAYPGPAHGSTCPRHAPVRRERRIRQ